MIIMDIDAFIDQEKAAVSSEFRAAAESSRNEAEFRTKSTRVIEKFAEDCGLSLVLREEYTLVNGRADAIYDRFVIEYEPPRSLRESRNARANVHAIAQIKRYLKGLEHLGHHKSERLAGVAFDGHFYIFVREREGVWHVDDPLPVSPASTERFLRTLASLSTESALIPENLVRDFGEKTRVAREVVSTFYAALASSDSKRSTVLFDQWSRQFSEVCDYEQASKVNVSDHARSYGVTALKVDPFRLFFSIHTYYAVLIKLLAVQITHFYLMPKMGTDLRSAATLDSERLRHYLSRMEDGGIFHELGINNFLEGDFFSWYLDAWSPRMENSLRTIVSTLANYSLVTLDVDPEATRDLLKHLYQDLMPKALRHNLGEYYTPDWLAQRTLNMLEGGKFTGDPKKRLLDPSCGSGTFLVLAIRAIREYGWKNTVRERDLLESILANVVGFDLNPLAVISARTNYLLALGDLLQHRAGEIAIPVYLCDSILTPVEKKDLWGNGACEFNTAAGAFSLPTSLVEARYIDRLAGILERSVKIKLSSDDFLARVAAELPVDLKKDQQEVRILAELYAKLLVLEESGLNGIWARIIKNAFAPLFAGEFHYVAGNPPWVNWESLPEEYREDTKRLWEQYGLFTLSGWKARMGGSKKDISMLMFYVAADKYLREHGRIGFVITQTIFKSAGAGDGFRRFVLGEDGPPLRVFWVDDMSAIKPFEGAANRTAVILAEKGAPTKYPVSIGYWRKRRRGSPLPESAELSQITEQLCRMSQWKAEPIDDQSPCSPWIAGRAKSIRAAKRIIGPADFRAHAGCCTWLNGVYWVDVLANRPDGQVIVSNRADIGKKKQNNIQAAVEKESLFHLLRGEDVSMWQAKPSLHIVLAQNEDSDSSEALPEDVLKRTRPSTYRYFASFESELRDRSGYRKYLSREPFYSVYNCGAHVFAQWKVVWREQASFLTCAVAGPLHGATVIPDHKLMIIPCCGPKQAYFACGVLSSSVAAYIVASYTVQTSTTTHVLNYVPVPAYEETSELHRQIAALCQRGHAAVGKGDEKRVLACKAELDKSAAKLWGMTNAELKDIQDSLQDLIG